MCFQGFCCRFSTCKGLTETLYICCTAFSLIETLQQPWMSFLCPVVLILPMSPFIHCICWAFREHSSTSELCCTEQLWYLCLCVFSYTTCCSKHLAGCFQVLVCTGILQQLALSGCRRAKPSVLVAGLQSGGSTNSGGGGTQSTSSNLSQHLTYTSYILKQTPQVSGTSTSWSRWTFQVAL